MDKITIEAATPCFRGGATQSNQWERLITKQEDETDLIQDGQSYHTISALCGVQWVSALTLKPATVFFHVPRQQGVIYPPYSKSDLYAIGDWYGQAVKHI